jgi:arsenite methyltransferase
MESLSFQRAEEIRASIKAKYRKVHKSADGLFPYPIGEAGALGLGYDPEWLQLVSTEVVKRFVGVGNPFRIHRPKKNDRILDVGCGCGLDTFIAAAMAGPSGAAVGIDFTAELLRYPREAAQSFRKGNVDFLEGSIEQLPFEAGAFDMLISNGVLNLLPDKQSGFRELARVLRRGGALVCADPLVIETIPDKILATVDAWSA